MAEGNGRYNPTQYIVKHNFCLVFTTNNKSTDSVIIQTWRVLDNSIATNKTLPSRTTDSNTIKVGFRMNQQGSWKRIM